MWVEPTRKEHLPCERRIPTDKAQTNVALRENFFIINRAMPARDVVFSYDPFLDHGLLSLEAKSSRDTVALHVLPAAYC